MSKEVSPLARILTDMSRDNLPGLSIDCVVLGFHEDQLHVLLLQWKHNEEWGLPGGFIKKTESFDEAAQRVLKSRTGLGDVFLKQFYTFGGKGRRQSKSLIDSFKKILLPTEQGLVDWVKQRHVTTGYLSLIRSKSADLSPDMLSKSLEWVPLSDRPGLFLDHDQILEKALEKIRIEISYLPIGKELLPVHFTLTQLRKLYEAILGRTLDRGNFQRKMLSLGHLIRLDKRKAGGAHRAPYLYTFDEEIYNELRKKGIGYL